VRRVVCDILRARRLVFVIVSPPRTSGVPCVAEFISGVDPAPQRADVHPINNRRKPGADMGKHTSRKTQA
jgi:hypothetical protein